MINIIICNLNLRFIIPNYLFIRKFITKNLFIEINFFKLFIFYVFIFFEYLLRTYFIFIMIVNKLKIKNSP